MSRFLKWLGLSSSVPPAPRRRPSWRPEIDPLEDRQLLSVSPLPAPHHHLVHVRAQSSTLGLEAMIFGLQHLGQSVTLDKNPGQVVIYNPSDPQPDNALFPSCANFVAAALQSVGAKTTADFGVVDPPGLPPNQPSPTNYVWGDLVLTFRPKIDAVSSLSAVQPGDVLQFRHVADGFEQHTAIVVSNLGHGRLLVVQQNANGRTWVTSVAPPGVPADVHDFNTFTGGTVWVYRPVAK
jgi:hypothetical protein